MKLIISAIKRAGLNLDILALPFSQGQNCYTEKYYRLAIKSISTHILKSSANKPGVISPSKIVLFYCSYPNIVQFLEKISIFASCHCVDRNKETHHDVGIYVVDCIRRFHVLRPQLPSKSSPMFLPLKNFADPSAREPIDSLYKKKLADSYNNPEEFQKIDIVPSREVINAKRTNVFIDARDLYFIVAKAMHGSPTLDDDDVDKLLLGLYGLYRFGSPIPNGFHYDVQHSSGKDLSGIDFYCQRLQKAVRSTDTYINIYPNDVIRE